jgi:pimeloyl-ACP methyl ester carboxylesterase
MTGELVLPAMQSPATMPRFEPATPQMIRMARPSGPLVVDLWSPSTPAQVAPILLIHGWGTAGFYWRETAQALSSTAQVIVPDLPGTGRSQPVRSAQNMFDQVATLAALLDELKVARVQVVGHSMGGAMALLLAQARPQAVESLVLTSTCFFLTERQVRIYRAIMQVSFLAMRFRPHWLADLPAFVRASAKRYFYRVPDAPDLLRHGLLDYLQLDYATAVACANNASDPAIPAAGAGVRVPTLLVACRQDEVMPVDNVEYTSMVIPRSQVRWMDECGHLPMVEKPAEYLDILRSFLDL